MSCSRTVSRFLAALVLTIGPLACGGARNDVAPAAGEGGEGPPSASENNINPMPRDRVQDGGKLTWPINSMPVHYNYLHLDGTEATTSLQNIRPAADLPREPRRYAVLESDYLTRSDVGTEPKQIVTYNITPRRVGTTARRSRGKIPWHWRATQRPNRRIRLRVTGYAISRV